MAEEETQEVATPEAEAGETQAAPTSEEAWQAQKTNLEEEKGRLQGELAQLQRQLQGKDRAITSMQRQLGEAKALQERIERIEKGVDALARFTLVEEDQEIKPPTRYEQFRKTVEPEPPKAPVSPQFTPEQQEASANMNRLLAEHGINPGTPPEDLVEVFDDVLDFWNANKPQKAERLLAKALTERKTKKESEAKVKPTEQEKQERARVAGTMKTEHSASSGSSLSPMSYESLSKIPMHRMTLEQSAAYAKRLQEKIEQDKIPFR